MNDVEEKREYKRVEKPFVVNLRIRPDEAQEIDSSGWDKVAVKDLGAGGIFFYHNKNLRIGSLVDLKIDIPKTSTPIHCVGKINRIKEHQNSPIFDIVVVFSEINDHEREIINKAVEECL